MGDEDVFPERKWIVSRAEKKVSALEKGRL
jgi:hypothetical protein